MSSKRRSPTPKRAPGKRAPLTGTGKRLKAESEMSKGKQYPSAPPENRGVYDPATTGAPQGGGPD